MATAFVLCLIVFLAFTGYSSGANYCLCKDGVGDSLMQKSIDYACGNGADCTGILQNGPCYNPNTIKDHCSYAVNSYYQRKAATGATCDFSGTATLSSNPPSSSTSGCYQTTPGNTGGGTTTVPGTTTPGTGTGTGTSTGTGTGTGTGTTTGINNPTFGLGPTGSGGFNPDGSGTETLHKNTVFFTIGILFTSLVCLRK
ncbi:PLASMODESMATA CALLOSE-BINDING PROTEIN 4-like [Nicotiana tomentosiformis]|uniref:PLASMODESMATA CALLOSE-BINDING PROTEIN 4-like n=1 Tax=Nicotiana tomentosiformis TaxID=4098 RepID=UPI00051B8EE8|nr:PLASMODESMATA CALLOSE-BINDING PROTEIN 4-like [Nicotiana tomentosiformis]